MSKQNIELSKNHINHNRIIPFVSPLFGLNSESKLFFLFMFFIGETLLLLDIKAKYPFAPSPARRPCCEQNNNTMFFTSEKNRIANQNADTANENAYSLLHSENTIFISPVYLA